MHNSNFTGLTYAFSGLLYNPCLKISDKKIPDPSNDGYKA